MFDDLPYPNEKNPVYRVLKVYSVFLVITSTGLIEKVLGEVSDGVAILMAIMMGIIVGIAGNQFLPEGVGFAAILVFIALPFLWVMLDVLRTCRKHERLN